MDEWNVGLTKKEETNVKTEILTSCVPCFGKAVVDAKDIYTDYLLNILTPMLHEGLRKLYHDAEEYEKKFEERAKKDKNAENPGVTALFLHLLKLNSFLILLT